MANEFTITFGPANSFSPNFTLHNGFDVSIASVSFSGKTAQFPITWDRIGDMAASDVTLAGTRGEDEEIVHMYFYNFQPGKTVTFENGDLDFTGDPQSVVPCRDIVGTRVFVMQEGGYPYTGEVKLIDGQVKAVVAQG